MCTLVIVPEVPSVKLNLSNMPTFSMLFQPLYSTGWNVEVTGRAKFAVAPKRDSRIPYAVTELTEFGIVKAFNSSLLDSLKFASPKGLPGMYQAALMHVKSLSVFIDISFP